MLSPIPIRPDFNAPLTSPGQLLPTPMGWPLTSPKPMGPSGAYVVQEGRLSLEMFALVEGEDGQRGAQPSLDLFSNLNGGAVAAQARLQKAPSVNMELYAPSHQPQKQAHPALAGATAGQLDAKNFYAAKLLQNLPAALDTEMQRAVAVAKGSLGMPSLDSTRIEAHLRAALQQEENAAAPSTAPGGVASAPHPAQPGRGDSAGPSASGPGSKRSAKRPHADTHPDPADNPPPKRRIERMQSLEAQVLRMYQLSRSLEHTAAQAEERRDAAVQENDSLWALAAHIHAAIATAVAQRKQEAQPAAVAAPRQPLQLQHWNQPRVPQQQQQQQQAPQHPALIPQEQRAQAPPAQVPQPATGLSALTPASLGLAALFSPDGEDLLAACNMFVSPDDRAATQARDKPRKLFEEPGGERAGPSAPPAALS